MLGCCPRSPEASAPWPWGLCLPLLSCGWAVPSVGFLGLLIAVVLVIRIHIYVFILLLLFVFFSFCLPAGATDCSPPGFPTEAMAEFFIKSQDVAAGCLALSRFSSSSSSVSVSPFSSLFSSLCSHCQGRHECIISTRINEYLELKLKHPYSFSQQMCLAQHRIQTIILLAVMLNRVKKRQNTHAVYHREKIQIIPDCWRSWSFVSGLVLKSVSVFAMKTWTFMYIWYQVTKRDNSWQTRVNYSSLLINSLVLFYSQSQIASEKTENRK